jgi:hypothetical protein
MKTKFQVFISHIFISILSHLSDSLRDHSLLYFYVYFALNNANYIQIKDNILLYSELAFIQLSHNYRVFIV